MAFTDLIGCSPTFRALLKNIDLVASADSTVLIQGETGTGKEAIARAIHEASPRRNHRFESINCAAVPAALLESELFGHEGDAFDGAAAQTSGRFQAADQGTVFLGEVGDLPMELQPKLLRVLQEGEFERLGSNQTIRVNVRVVAATNQDLMHLLVHEQFRADLYYRLNVVSVFLPPLRERKQDIPLLAEYFVRKLSARLSRTIEVIPPELVEILQSHDWPGNIRELQNLMERAVLFSPESVLRLPFDGLKQMAKLPLSDSARNLAQAENKHVVDAQRVAAMSTLVASIAHEISQPLTGIVTNASTCIRMLDADAVNVDGARETLRRIIRDGQRAAGVITHLRAMFSKKEFALEPVDLNEVTRQVIALAQYDLQRNRVVVELALADPLPIVMGDRIQLQQVVLNLLQNASEAMAEVNDRPRHLAVKTETDDDLRIRVTVRDAGVGLDPESLDKLFHPFFTTKQGGMGIGLSVSRSIIERHQGRMWAQPNDGPGATFAFSIPVCTTHDTAC